MGSKEPEPRRIITITVDDDGSADIQIDPEFHSWEVRGLAGELHDMAEDMEEENGE